MQKAPKIHKHLPMSVVRFTNIEAPGMSVDASWGPDTSTIATYHFEDGKIYEIPTEYINLMQEKCIMKNWVQEHDPATGQDKMVQKGVRSRFSFADVQMKKPITPAKPKWTGKPDPSKANFGKKEEPVGAK